MGMTMQTTTCTRLFGKEDGCDPGIEALGLSVRIEVGEWDLVIFASAIENDGWRAKTLDDRLPDLVRALSLMVDLRAGERRQEAS